MISVPSSHAVGMQQAEMSQQSGGGGNVWLRFTSIEIELTGHKHHAALLSL